MQQFMAIGRITRDIEKATTNNGVEVARFTLAVPRDKEHCDFLNCVAWKGRADILSKYTKKGSKIAVFGKVQTDTYEKDGQKVYKTEVIVDKVELLDKKETTEDKEWQPADTGDLPF